MRDKGVILYSLRKFNNRLVISNILYSRIKKKIDLKLHVGIAGLLSTGLSKNK